jgi:hypothetical protein
MMTVEFNPKWGFNEYDPGARLVAWGIAQEWWLTTMVYFSQSHMERLHDVWLPCISLVQ